MVVKCLTSHVRRYHRHDGGSRHVWQGRLKAFPIQQDERLLAVLRYAERNLLRANFVRRARSIVPVLVSLERKHGLPVVILHNSPNRMRLFLALFNSLLPILQESQAIIVVIFDFASFKQLYAKAAIAF